MYEVLYYFFTKLYKTFPQSSRGGLHKQHKPYIGE